MGGGGLDEYIGLPQRTDKKGNKSQSFEEDAFITIDLSTHKIKWGPLSKYSRMCGCH